MSKKITIGRFAGRMGFNVVVAGVLFAFLGNLLAGIEGTGGALVGTVVPLVALLWLVPAILQARPGQETFLSFVLAIPTGIAVVNLLQTLFNVSLPVLTVSGTDIFSMSFLLAMASYFAADLIFIKFWRK